MTDIIPGARLYLLRTLAAVRDWEATREPSPYWPTHTPLYGAGEHPYDDESMELAVRESAALGHIEATDVRTKSPYGYMLRITDAGYDHIRVHDVLGEDAQEALSS